MAANAHDIKILTLKKTFNRLVGPVYYLLLATLFIFSILPSIPGREDKTGDSSWRIDYLMHFSMFFMLGAITVIFSLKNKMTTKKALVLFLAIISYSAVSEIIQIYIPGRSFNPVDLLLNEAGFIAGILVLVGLRSKAIKLLALHQ
jgi:VanZ family protein